MRRASHGGRPTNRTRAKGRITTPKKSTCSGCAAACGLQHRAPCCSGGLWSAAHTVHAPRRRAHVRRARAHTHTLKRQKSASDPGQFVAALKAPRTGVEQRVFADGPLGTQLKLAPCSFAADKFSHDAASGFIHRAAGASGDLCVAVGAGCGRAGALPHQRLGLQARRRQGRPRLPQRGGPRRRQTRLAGPGASSRRASRARPGRSGTCVWASHGHRDEEQPHPAGCQGPGAGGRPPDASAYTAVTAGRARWCAGETKVCGCCR